MADFMQNFINSRMGPGILVTIGGMASVFIVLILFYLIIILLTRIFPYKPEA